MWAEVNTMRDGWFGWYGCGGSVNQYHPELNIAFAYTSNDLLTLESTRGAHMQACVADIVRKGKK
jgi:CubicO group peptidase (beta-lactamase class C family)